MSKFSKSSLSCLGCINLFLKNKSDETLMPIFSKSSLSCLGYINLFFRNKADEAYCLNFRNQVYRALDLLSYISIKVRQI